MKLLKLLLLIAGLTSATGVEAGKRGKEDKQQRGNEEGRGSEAERTERQRRERAERADRRNHAAVPPVSVPAPAPVPVEAPAPAPAPVVPAEEIENCVFCDNPVLPRTGVLPGQYFAGCSHTNMHDTDECVRRWIAQGSANCPLCRRNLTEEARAGLALLIDRLGTGDAVTVRYILAPLIEILPGLLADTQLTQPLINIFLQIPLLLQNLRMPEFQAIVDEEMQRLMQVQGLVEQLEQPGALGFQLEVPRGGLAIALEEIVSRVMQGLLLHENTAAAIGVIRTNFGPLAERIRFHGDAIVAAFRLIGQRTVERIPALNDLVTQIMPMENAGQAAIIEAMMPMLPQFVTLMPENLAPEFMQIVATGNLELHGAIMNIFQVLLLPSFDSSFDESSDAGSDND